ncbi:Major facilitator superfamily domain-containing protein 6 [Phytophthora ramorum]|uniref:Major facilitator superfamily domain-containing protein 6 n=1 Tax=Phytophthora ramorum TaxID=164328 RepID=UPI00309EFA5F|nr:Major facilitator superfamily domain-containing protein 6 [Phytophthora ramorum]
MTTTVPKPPIGCHRWLWELKLMYALNSAWGSTTGNYLPVYYQHTAGFSKMQIGLLQTLPSIAAILGPPIWGGVADRIRNQRLVHVFCIVSGTLLQFSTRYFYWSLGWTVFMVFISQIQTCPTGSLLDHTVLNLLAKEGGEYGRQRLFGAVGWGIGTYLTGVVVAFGGIFWSFNLCLIAGFSTLLVLRLIPPVKYGEEYTALETGDEEECSGSVGAPSFLETMRLVSQKPDVLVLLGVVFIMGNMHGVFTSFLQLNLYNLAGDNPHIIGVAIMCETSSELPAFFFADKIIKKIGTVNVLLVSLVGYTLRITYYALMTNAWGAIPFEFLHGITFGLAWAACTQYVFSAAPRGCEGTVMGVLSAVQNGLARASGTLIGGYFYENYGARTMWVVADIGVPLSLISLAIFAYLKEEESVDMQQEELLQERAALFSPHSGNPQGLKSPMTPQGLSSSVHLTYDSVQ